MKVLMINVVCGIRSTGRICTDLAQALESQGHEVKIAYGRERVPEQYQKYAVRIGNDLDVSIAGAEARLFDNEGLSCKKATKQFLQWADNYNPNLLWLHNIHGYYINYELLFSWIKSRPQMKVQWTLHDCWAFTGHCTYFSMAKCDQWKTCCKKCPQLREYPACYGLGHVKKNYNKKKSTFTGVKDLTLITPSRWLANLTRESFFKEYPVEIHYNKIDTNIFRPTPSDFRKKYGLENKIIIFPQSISYSNDDKGKYESTVAQRIYSAHQHLTIFSRDTSSYKMMRKILHNVDIRLCPDIVFSLLDIVHTEKKQGVGMCIRNDKESCLSDEDKNLLMEQVGQKYSRINNFSTTITTEKDIFGEERRNLVLSKLQEISQFELVITDRLHGMIFAYITSTPCIALNNTTGKSYFAYKDWLSDKENVVFLNDKFEIDDLPKSMHSVEMNFDTLKNCLTNDM